MEEAKAIAYRKAQRRVQKLKRFYRHLNVYVVVNVIVVFFGLGGIDLLQTKTMDVDANFVPWLHWNVLSVPILWGIGLLIYGLCVFRPTLGFLEAWERRQLQKIMEEEYRKENPM
jgi:hypothetical protein